VDAVLDLLIDGETGIWHVTNQGRVSWATFASMILERAGLDSRTIHAVDDTQLSLRAPRPRDVALASARGALLSSLESAVDRFVEACEMDGIARDARAIPATAGRMVQRQSDNAETLTNG